MPLHACIHAHVNVFCECVCVCVCVDKPRATIFCLLIHSHHLISIWIDSCNADSFHPCYSWKQPITASTEHSTAAHWCMCVWLCVCHSLTADSVTTHPVFLTHLYQNCNLAHWTFKLLDVTSKGIGEEKHYLLLITSPTSVKPVFASLPPFYSTCYFLLVIFFSLFFWTVAPSRSSHLLESIFFVQYCQSKMSLFPHWQACLYCLWND